MKSKKIEQEGGKGLKLRVGSPHMQSSKISAGIRLISSTSCDDGITVKVPCVQKAFTKHVSYLQTFCPH